MPPKKAKKSKRKASAGGSAFAIDFTNDLCKTVQVPGSFWQMKGDDKNQMFDCTVMEYDKDHDFGGSLDEVSFIALVKLQSSDANIDR